MLRKLIDKFLHSASHSRRRQYSSSAKHYGKRHSSSAKHYGKRYSSSHGYYRPMIGSSSDGKRRHGHMGHEYYKSRRRSSS